MDPFVEHPALHDAWRQYMLGFTGEAKRRAKRIYDEAKRRGDVVEGAVAETLLGMIAREDLDLTTGEAHLDRALAALTAALGEAHLETLHARAQRLGLYHEQVRRDDIRREVAALRPLTPPLVAPLDRRLVSLHLVLGCSADSSRPEELAAKRALGEVLEALDGDELAELRATTLLHLGATHQSLGEHEAAIGLYAECIALRARTLGEGSPRVALTRFGLASAMVPAGRAKEALAEAQAAMATMRKLGLDKTPRMSNGWATLALAWLYNDRVDEATEALERAIAIEEKTFGASHRQTARLVGMLATLHGARGNAAKVASLLGRAMTVILDANEGSVAELTETYLGALTRTGRHRVASQWSQRELAKRKGRLPDAVVAAMEWSIAQAHMLDGELKAAQPPLERAIAAARGAYGADGKVTKEYEHHLAMLRSGAKPQRRNFA